MGSGSGPLAITTRSAKNMRVNSGSMLPARCLADDFLIYWVPITRSVPRFAGMD